MWEKSFMVKYSDRFQNSCLAILKHLGKDEHHHKGKRQSNGSDSWKITSHAVNGLPSDARIQDIGAYVNIKGKLSTVANIKEKKAWY